MSIPGYKTFATRIFGRKIVYDLLIALAALFGGGASALRAFHSAYLADQKAEFNCDWIAGILFSCGSVAVAGIAICKFVVEWKKLEDEETPRDLDGCLHTLHAVLLGLYEGEGDGGLRLTIHILSPSGDRLEQVVEYVGSQRAGKKTVPRSFTANSGVIGECLQTKTLSCGKWTGVDHEQLIGELTTRWNYSDQAARDLNKDSRAWVAVPILDTCWCGKRDLLGIIYADATDPDFFGPESNVLTDYAADGIARYVKRRYK